MQEALNSPYGVGPSALPDQSSPEDQFIQQLGQVRIPQAEGAPSRVPANEPALVDAPADPDAALSKVDPMDAAFAEADPMDAAFAAAEGQPSGEAPTVGKPSFEEMSAELGPVEAAKRSIGDSLSRAKLSFAVNDWEKTETLKKMYGAENVRTKDGKVQFRRKGDRGFRDLDPSQIEYIDDALDFARTATEVGAELPVRGAAATAGALAGSAAGPGGTVAGALAAGAASGAIGAMAAQTVGDFIAQGLLGIPKDPKRSAGQELAVAGGMGALFGSAGKVLSQWRLGKEAAKAANANATTALKTAQELEEISDNLARNGINLKQGKITLSPGQQASQYLPEGQSLDTHLGTEGPVRNFFEEQGRMFTAGWDDIRHGITNVTGKNADELFSKVKESSKLSTELEGKMIEGFRDQALAVSKGQPRALPQATQALEDFMFGADGLGFRRVPGRDAITFQPKMTIAAPSLKEMKSRFPEASTPALTELVSKLRSMEGAVRKGGGQLNLAETNKIYTGMRKFIDNNIGTKNDSVAKSLIGLKNELRDDWTMAIGQELEQYGKSVAHGGVFPDMKGMTKIRPNALNDYMASMAKYSDMKKAQDTLGNILQKNDLSAAAFADQLFSPSQGKDKVRQIKILINENSPELWDKLRGTYLDTLTEKHTKLVKGAGANLERRIDWQGLNKTIDKLDRAEILDQVFDAKSTFNKQQLKDFFNLAGRIDNTVRLDENALQSAGVLQKMRQLATVVLPGTSNTAKIANVSTLIGGMGKDKAVARWLNGEGLELVVKGLPKPKQSAARQMLSAAVNQALKTEARMGVNTVLRDDSEVMP